MSEAREWWRNPRIVSVDEISFHENDLRGYTWCKRGERCVVSTPAARGTRYSVICALSSFEGLIAYKMCTGSAKALDVLELLRNLRVCGIDKVVLDNAAIHRAKVLKASSTCPDLVFLPPYSPDLAPIEFYFRAFRAKFHRHCHRNCRSVLERMLHESANRHEDWSETFRRCWQR